jgi:hypothetical protein
MNTADEYTPNPEDTSSEHMGATEGNDWTPVRVPGGDQGVLGGRRPDDNTEAELGEAPSEDAEDEFSAYDQTTGG